MEIKCSECGKFFEAPTDTMGTTVNCPLCSHSLSIPLIRYQGQPTPSMQRIRGLTPWAITAFSLFMAAAFLILSDRGENKSTLQEPSPIQKIEDSPEESQNDEDEFSAIRNQILADVKQLGKEVIVGKETVTMEELMLFCDRYLGEKLVFHDCRVIGIKEVDEGVFAFSLFSSGGEYFWDYKSPKFLTRGSLAEQIARTHLAGGMQHTTRCTIQCRVVSEEIIFVIGIDTHILGVPGTTIYRYGFTGVK